ncbi:MAG: hypothetical protein ABW098_19795 [Candidatus Thiodiazotropha sp.]
MKKTIAKRLLVTSTIFFISTHCEASEEMSLLDYSLNNASIFPAKDLCKTHFQVNDTPVRNAEAFRVIDHEFDKIHNRITFFDDNNNSIVVGSIDNVTGDLVEGETLVIDRPKTMGLEPITTYPLVPVGNGPEWGADQTRGSVIYYTKQDRYDPRNIFLTRAYQPDNIDSGAYFNPMAPWVIEEVPNSRGRYCAIASQEPDDLHAWIGYVKTTQGTDSEYHIDIAWSHDAPFKEDRPVDGIDLSNMTGGSPARKIPGRLEIAAIMLRDGQPQIARYNLENDEPVYISDYPACETAEDPDCQSVELNSVSVVAVPSQGPDAFVIYGIVNNNYIDPYFMADDSSDPVRLAQIRPELPSGSATQYIIDEENFIDEDGNPYLVFSMGTEPKNGSPGDIWIASPFATTPCGYRKVTADYAGDPTRKYDLDPLTLQGVDTFVYYQELDDSMNSVLRKAATGL